MKFIARAKRYRWRATLWGEKTQKSQVKILSLPVSGPRPGSWTMKAIRRVCNPPRVNSTRFLVVKCISGRSGPGNSLYRSLTMCWEVYSPCGGVRAARHSLRCKNSKFPDENPDPRCRGRASAPGRRRLIWRVCCSPLERI